MKKTFLLLFCIIAAISASSQSFYGGLALGGVASQIDGDGNGGLHKIGFTGGGFVGLKLSDIFDIQLELKYIQKGSSSSVEDAQHFKISLDYVELPLLGSANLGFIKINGKKIDWIALEFGFSMDVLFHCNLQYNGANEGQNQWKRLCLNGLFGLKFNLAPKMKNGRLDLCFRALPGITSAYAGNFMKNRVRFWQKGAFNDAIELVLYYRFK